MLPTILFFRGTTVISIGTYKEYSTEIWFGSTIILKQDENKR